MKVRQGFVSNSSSSSFIVVSRERDAAPELNKKTLSVPDDFGGETEFGWGPEKHYDIGSKINFAYMQTQYVKEEIDPLLEKAYTHLNIHNNKKLKMLEDVIKEEFNIDEIEWNINMEDYSCYIDHQSCGREGRNLEIFESRNDLRDFIFNNSSYIHEDNDNH